MFVIPNARESAGEESAVAATPQKAKGATHGRAFFTKFFSILPE